MARRAASRPELAGGRNDSGRQLLRWIGPKRPRNTCLGRDDRQRRPSQEVAVGIGQLSQQASGKLTAMAVVVGASVILFAPIFQGLAIALMAGEIASLLISRRAVPVLYYMAYKHKGTSHL